MQRSHSEPPPASSGLEEWAADLDPYRSAPGYAEWYYATKRSRAAQQLARLLPPVAPTAHHRAAVARAKVGQATAELSAALPPRHADGPSAPDAPAPRAPGPRAPPRELDGVLSAGAVPLVPPSPPAHSPPAGGAVLGPAPMQTAPLPAAPLSAPPTRTVLLVSLEQAQELQRLTGQGPAQVFERGGATHALAPTPGTPQQQPLPAPISAPPAGTYLGEPGAAEGYFAAPAVQYAAPLEGSTLPAGAISAGLLYDLAPLDPAAPPPPPPMRPPAAPPAPAELQRPPAQGRAPRTGGKGPAGRGSAGTPPTSKRSEWGGHRDATLGNGIAVTPPRQKAEARDFTAPTWPEGGGRGKRGEYLSNAPPRPMWPETPPRADKGGRGSQKGSEGTPKHRGGGKGMSDGVMSRGSSSRGSSKGSMLGRGASRGRGQHKSAPRKGGWDQGKGRRREGWAGQHPWGEWGYNSQSSKDPAEEMWHRSGMSVIVPVDSPVKPAAA
eukprot:TRINITY_DN6477_c0_g2_i1.p1 TRINITY_DN6477_c0_g2~~TRINITY_DN6477_c0_g2_i1.p1  ORF type:complete len:546 (+),score=142.40 TRINITY_DN6477_c0_g2_i1:154-1638(+)